MSKKQVNNPNQNGKSYIVWSAGIVICLIAAVLALVLTSCSGNTKKPTASPTPSPSETVETSPDVSPEGDAPTVDPAASPTGGEEPANSPAPTESTSPADTVAPGDTVLAETDDMGQEYVDKFVFLGDSTTYGLAHYDIVNDSQVWTPASGTLTLNLWSTATIVYPDTGEEISIVDAVTRKQPEYMLITLGVNGVSFLDEEGFTSEYENLVNAIREASPNTKIICNSIYPVSAKYPESNGITNPKIDAANTWVLNAARSCGVHYLNSCSVIKDANGALPDNLQNGDNIHLNPDGYNAMIGYLRTHGC